ncbi:MAG: hypothetical protein M3245_04645 [Actinomycetota bacterium]|nr:hypothetical protein [Actinomycetota bacterium]
MNLPQSPGEAVATARRYLASPEGRPMRARVAIVMAASAPLIASLPPLRASRLGRLIGVAGGAALVVRVADLIRDWEPGTVRV